MTYLLIRLLALFLLFWLGSATGHISRTPTTTPFQYLENRCLANNEDFSNWIFYFSSISSVSNLSFWYIFEWVTTSYEPFGASSLPRSERNCAASCGARPPDSLLRPKGPRKGLSCDLGNEYWQLPSTLMRLLAGNTWDLLERILSLSFLWQVDWGVRLSRATYSQYQIRREPLSVKSRRKSSYVGKEVIRSGSYSADFSEIYTYEILRRLVKLWKAEDRPATGMAEVGTKGPE